MKNERLKIGLFIDAFYPMIDGVVQVVDNYATRLSKFADVTVFTVDPRNKNYKDNFTYKVVRCHKLEVPGLDYDLGLPTLDNEFMTELKNAKLDIVHIHSPFSLGKIGLQYAKKHKIPCIATNHSQFKQDFFRATKSRAITGILLANIMDVFNKCDENWAVNEGVADLFVKDYGLKAPVTVQYNATNHKPVKNVNKANQMVNKKYNLKKNELVFCFVGRLSVLKNILFIADALKILKDKGLDFKTIFVGSGTDEKLLKKKIDNLNLNEQTIFVGKVANKNLLQSIYCRSKLLLFPSVYDTDGLVKYEAACQKTPTVSIKGFLCAGNIKDNENGFLTDYTAQSFADKIYEVCQNDELYAQVSNNAFKTLYKTWDEVVEKVYNDYIKLIEKKKTQLKTKKKARLYPKTVKLVQKTKFDLKKSKNKLKKQTKNTKEKIKIKKEK
ncbi:MAG: glycosyltransferase [Christensenellales bacterium]